MVYETDNMTLVPVREVLRANANDVLVCQDTAARLRPFYTLLAVKDPACAKRLLAAIGTSDKPADPDYPGCLAVFAQNEQLCFLFPYRAQRRLSSFADSQLNTPRKREEMAINLVMECLVAAFPYPLLYLMLAQDNVNLQSDNKIFFTPHVDLGELDDTVSEADCVGLCAALLLCHLEDENPKGLKTLVLLRKKLARSAYQSFPELYRDIRLAMLPQKKTGFFARLGGFWRRNKGRLFRILMVVMVVAIVLALIMLISQIIFGDFFLFRLLENKFRVIGTERLG